MIKAIRLLVLAAVLVAGLSGCSLIDYYFLPPPEDTAQELYEAGVDAMRDKNYADAAEYFVKIKDRYPFSPYTERAEIGLGDAYFLDEQYALAADAYKEFEVLHPRHEQTPYVLYQVGLSNYRMFRSLDLRQENISEAIEYFTRVVDAYPDTEFARQAQENILKSRRIQCEHEVYIADFFYRTQKYGPAWNRYKFVVENFADITDLQEYARNRAQYAYFEYQKTLSEQERARVHGGWLQWLKDWL
ncbi:MAG: outer membrane protein assembly factor BamD [Desulfovibrionaceae bacterium]